MKLEQSRERPARRHTCRRPPWCGGGDHRNRAGRFTAGGMVAHTVHCLCFRSCGYRLGLHRFCCSGRAYQSARGGNRRCRRLYCGRCIGDHRPCLDLGRVVGNTRAEGPVAASYAVRSQHAVVATFLRHCRLRRRNNSCGTPRYGNRLPCLTASPVRISCPLLARNPRL